MKIYLAIPYSGKKLASFKISNIVAAKLISDGHIVYAPISHSHPIATDGNIEGSYETWRKIDEEFILWCNVVVVVDLPGWEKSVGVGEEIIYGREKNKSVLPFSFFYSKFFKKICEIWKED